MGNYYKLYIEAINKLPEGYEIDKQLSLKYKNMIATTNRCLLVEYINNEWIKVIDYNLEK